MTDVKKPGTARGNGARRNRSSPAFALVGLAPPPKRSELLASDIVEEIVARDLQPGDMLPSEASMLEQYGVGRASLREALRLLEAQGLVRMKRGPRGGPVVGAVSAENLGRTASLYFRLAGATYGVLSEAMEVLEPWLAELAARRCPREETEAALGACITTFEASIGDAKDAWRTGPQFHDVMHRLSGNPVLETMASAVGAIFRTQVLSLVDLEPHQPRFLEAHRQLTAAIAAGQPAKARQLAFEHVQDMVRVVTDQIPGLLSQVIEWR